VLETGGLFGGFLNVLENPNLFFSTKRSATAGAEPAARLAGSSKVNATSRSLALTGCLNDQNRRFGRGAPRAAARRPRCGIAHA
jgi:hypothetical protein